MTLHPYLLFFEPFLRLFSYFGRLIPYFLLDLQSLTQKTHHPIAKLEVASDWFRQSHIFCSTPKLLDLRNQLPEIMGTADARGELLQLINNALQKKSETKNKAGVLPPALPSS